MPKTKVVIKDRALEDTIRKKLGKPKGSITADDMLNIKEFEYNSDCVRGNRKSSLKDLTGLGYAKKLTKISITDNKVNDLSPLANCNNLREIDAGRNRISDLSPLSDLNSLKKLYLNMNKIRDITPLKNLKQLIHLNIKRNGVRNMMPLSRLPKLSKVKIKYNREKKFFLHYMNQSKVPYFKYMQELSLITDITDSQMRKIEGLLYASNEREAPGRAKVALKKTPIAFVFARTVLDDEEMKASFKEAISSGYVKRYVKNFLKVKPYGEESRNFLEQHGNLEVKRMMIEYALKN